MGHLLSAPMNRNVLVKIMLDEARGIAVLIVTVAIDTGLGFTDLLGIHRDI